MPDLKNFTRIEAAMEMIDASLGGMTDRHLVPTAEVTDLLLDVRMLLSAVGPAASVDANASEDADVSERPDSDASPLAEG